MALEIPYDRSTPTETRTSTRQVSLSREGESFRLIFGYSEALVEKVRNLPYARFDPDSKSWTSQVCTQSVEQLRRWFADGLCDIPVDTLLRSGEVLAPIADAVLRPGTLRRPYQVVTAIRNDQTFARLRAIPGASWDRTSHALSYPTHAASALSELVERGVLDDPAKLLSPADVTISFDARNGTFMVRGDDRAQKAFDHYFPSQDVVAKWRGRELDVGFADTFTEEVYRGELARAAGGMQPVGLNATLWPYQAQSVGVALERSGFGVFHEMGLGKAERNGTPVLTPTGWCPIEELQVGGHVIGADGRATEVTGVFPRGVLATYTVTFDDGATLVVGGDHLWSVGPGPHAGDDAVASAVIETTALLADFDAGFDADGNASCWIPLVAPVQFAPAPPLPRPPYVAARQLLDWNHVVPTAPFDRIPAANRTASVADRLDFLHGLLADCGEIDAHGAVVLDCHAATPASLLDDIIDLVRSLGGVAQIATSTPATSTPAASTPASAAAGVSRMQLRIDLPQLCPVPDAARAADWRQRTETAPARTKRAGRRIIAIEPTGPAAVTCIAVAAIDHLYVTDHYLVTHNTVVAIGTGHELMFNREEIARTVVVVPGSVRTQWKNEIERFSTGTVVVVDGDLKKRKAAYAAAADAQWLIVHYDILHRDFALLAPLVAGTLLVADEAHRLKSATSKRTLAMRKLAGKASRRLALTGTPIQNDPGEWYSVISGFVEPGCFGSPSDFLNRYSYPSRFGGFEGARNLGELRTRSSTYYIRYVKAEVATHLPPLRVQHRPLDVDPTYRNALVRAHREARDEIKAAALTRAEKRGDIGHALDGDALDEVTTGAEMTAVGMLRLLCTSPRVVESSDSAAAQALSDAGLLPDADGPKLDELRGMAAELQENGQRVVVFTFSKRMANLIAERFKEDGIRYVLFTGDTSSKDRDLAVEQFTAAATDDHPGPTAFVATDAGGEGLNLGHHCSLLVNMDIPWTPGVLAQRSARIHRMDGTAEKYLVINFTLRGTIEEGILRMVERKADLQDAIFGEGGGRSRTTGRGGRGVFDEAMAEWDASNESTR